MALKPFTTEDRRLSSENEKLEDGSPPLTPPYDAVDSKQAVTAPASNPDETVQSDAATADPQYPSGLKLTAIIFALCIAIFLVALDQTIIAPALGTITARFNSVKDIVRMSNHIGDVFFPSFYFVICTSSVVYIFYRSF